MDGWDEWPADEERAAVLRADPADEQPGDAGGDQGDPAADKPAWLLGRYSRSASLSLDSLPRDSLGPGGLKRGGGNGPFVPAQAARRGADDSPESPLTDVVPAARTPVEEEEPAG